MKIHIGSFVILSFLLIGTALASKKSHKDQWREKKEKHLKSFDKKHHVADGVKENDLDYAKAKKGDFDSFNPTEYKGETHSHKLKHYFGKKKLFKKSKHFVADRDVRKPYKSVALHDLRIKKDCDVKCKPMEVCIAGPVDRKHMCMNKKEFKKSMKMFYRHHTKEVKELKRYQKKWTNEDLKRVTKTFGSKDGLSKYVQTLRKDDKLKRMKNEKRNKLGKKKHHFEKDLQKKIKSKYNVHPKSKGTECGPSEMTQMRTRMMGWFHLLHGQDHAARKAHGGSIAKFYKHVSAKKELRELNGEKCQCMKSAMWQFHQMDKDHDDHLTHAELLMLEENTLEPCMRPYLDSCDKNGDEKITSDEWCCCFTNVLPPCFKELNEVRKSGDKVTYMPRCDKEGYFMLEQCKGGNSDIPLTCWCVDYNGNEYKDTIKEGRAHCHKIAKYGDKLAIPLA